MSVETSRLLVRVAAVLELADSDVGAGDNDVAVGRLIELSGEPAGDGSIVALGMKKGAEGVRQRGRRPGRRRAYGEDRWCNRCWPPSRHEGGKEEDTSLMSWAYCLGEEQMTTLRWFLAEDLNMEGPPISMFSMQVLKSQPCGIKANGGKVP